MLFNFLFVDFSLISHGWRGCIPSLVTFLESKMRPSPLVFPETISHILLKRLVFWIILMPDSEMLQLSLREKEEMSSFSL